MALALGAGAYIGFGEESTYGTAVTRTKFLRFLSERLKVTDDLLQSDAITGGFRRNIYTKKGIRRVEGTFTVEPEVDNTPLLFKHALGSVSSSQPDAVGAPNTYKHEFTPGSLPTGLTIEVYRGDPAGASNAFVYAGCKIAEMVLSCDVNAFLTAEFTVMGASETNASKSTPSFSTKKPFVFSEGTLSWGGSAVAVVTSASVRLNNNLTLRHGLGSVTTKEPQFGGKREVTGEFTAEFDSIDIYNDFLAATERALQLKFQGALIEATYYETIQIDCAVALAEDFEAYVESEGPITQRIPFVALDDGTNPVMKITVYNTVSSY